MACPVGEFLFGRCAWLTLARTSSEGPCSFCAGTGGKLGCRGLPSAGKLAPCKGLPVSAPKGWLLSPVRLPVPPLQRVHAANLPYYNVTDRMPSTRERAALFSRTASEPDAMKRYPKS